MRLLLKSLTVLLTVFVAVGLGICLLEGFVLWKVLLWALSCAGLGNGVYNIMRAIDKHTAAPAPRDGSGR